jgi:hypothetical protein
VTFHTGQIDQTEKYAWHLASITSLFLTQLLLETANPDDYNILWGGKKNIPYFVDFSLDKPVCESKMRLHNSGKYGLPYRVVLTGANSPLRLRVLVRKKGMSFPKDPVFQFSLSEEALQC